MLRTHDTRVVGNAVANIARFVPQLQHLPRYVTQAERGDGFVQLSEHLLKK